MKNTIQAPSLAEVPPRTLVLSSAPRSHVGRVRTENQDSVTAFYSLNGEVFLVADGMGGHVGGKQAAAMVTVGFQRHLEHSNKPVDEALAEATTLTNTEIRDAQAADPALAGMGSTVVVAVVKDSTLHVGHVGDSRAYLYREGKLHGLTRDHTVVQRLVDAGILTENAAREHPDSSVLSRALGHRAETEMELRPAVPLQPEDGILLCSDGLTGYVDEAVIEATIRGHQGNPDRVADALLNLALEAGGEDNITVQYIEVRLKEAAEVPPHTMTAGRTLPGNPQASGARAAVTALGVPSELQGPSGERRRVPRFLVGGLLSAATGIVLLVLFAFYYTSYTDGSRQSARETGEKASASTQTSLAAAAIEGTAPNLPESRSAPPGPLASASPPAASNSTSLPLTPAQSAAPTPSGRVVILADPQHQGATNVRPTASESATAKARTAARDYEVVALYATDTQKLLLSTETRVQYQPGFQDVANKVAEAIGVGVPQVFSAETETNFKRASVVVLIGTGDVR